VNSIYLFHQLLQNLRNLTTLTLTTTATLDMTFTQTLTVTFGDDLDLDFDIDLDFDLDLGNNLELDPWKIIFADNGFIIKTLFYGLFLFQVYICVKDTYMNLSFILIRIVCELYLFQQLKNLRNVVAAFLSFIRL